MATSARVHQESRKEVCGCGDFLSTCQLVLQLGLQLVCVCVYVLCVCAYVCACLLKGGCVSTYFPQRT